MTMDTKLVCMFVIFILQLVGVLHTVDLKGCPKDWKKFENSCYMSPSVTADWFGSQANCSQYNAHLVSISSERENSFLIREVAWNKQCIWIGLKRTPFDYSAWAWADGSLMTFTDWISGQPDDFGAGEGCAQLYTKRNNGHWNDVTCRKNLSFVCEKVLIADLITCSDDNGGCPHLCLSTFSGPRCKCKDGFISEKDGTVCLDPTMLMSQEEAQTHTVHLFDVALLIFLLLSFILLVPMSRVLNSFYNYRRVSRQRRLKAQRTIMINSPPSNDQHCLENQASSLTNLNSSYDNENISDVQV